MMYRGKCCNCGHMVELHEMKFGPSPMSEEETMRIAKEQVDRLLRSLEESTEDDWVKEGGRWRLTLS